VHSFATLLTATHGIGSAQTTGTQLMQNYAQALKAATGDATTLSTALMLTGENADYTTKAVNAVNGATAEAGGHVKGWADIQSTFNQKMAEAKDGLEAAAISMGTRLLPMASAALGVLAAHIPDIIAVGNKMIDIGVAVGGVVSAMGPFLPAIATAVGLFIAFRTAMTIGTAIQGVVTMVQALVGGMQMIAGATAAANGEMIVFESTETVAGTETGALAAAQWALNVAMDANPIGLIVLGIAALVVVVVLLATHWSQVTAALHAFWGKIQQVAASITTFIDQHRALAAVLIVLAGPVGIVVALVAVLITHWHQVTAAVGTFFEALGHGFGPLQALASALNVLGAPRQLLAGLVAADNAIKGFVSSATSAIGGFFSRLGSAVSAGWAAFAANPAYWIGYLVTYVPVKLFELQGQFEVWVAGMILRALAWAEQMYTTAQDMAANFLLAVGQEFQRLPGQIANWLANVIPQILDWAGHMATAAGQAAISFGNAFTAEVNKLPGQMVTLGGQIVGGLVQGVLGDIGNAASAAGSLVSGMIDGAKAAAGNPHSPAPATVPLGMALAQGLTFGVQQEAANARGAMSALVGSMTGGPAAGSLASTPGYSSTALQSSGGSLDMQDTNSLLAQLYDLLDERLPRAPGARFSNRAYGTT
jgi:hypothetical protein